MKGKVCISLCLFLLIVFSVMGCAQSGGSGFVKKEFLEYENIAILPFEGDDTGEVSKAFARNFHERFRRFQSWADGSSWTTLKKRNSILTNWMMRRD